MKDNVDSVQYEEKYMKETLEGLRLQFQIFAAHKYVSYVYLITGCRFITKPGCSHEIIRLYCNEEIMGGEVVHPRATLEGRLTNRIESNTSYVNFHKDTAFSLVPLT